MVRFGILGVARIARLFPARGMAHASIVAVASRDLRKAEAFAREHGIDRSYGSYEALLEDPSVDAVLIPLPHHLHCEYTVKAAEAGKHVLVEKPAALSVAEVETMAAACRAHNVLLMEGLMYRFKKIHRRVKEFVDSGLLGRVHYIDFNWCFNIHAMGRTGFRLDPGVGGGALYDVGVYGADFLHFLTGKTPRLLAAQIHRTAPGGVDMLTHATCDMEGVLGTITCGYTSDANYYAVSGEQGALMVPGSVAGRIVDNSIEIHLHEGDKRYQETFVAENPYQSEMDYFAECIDAGRQPAVDSMNSARNIGLIEEIIRRASGF
jgi:xylose dehydrogenase (NAD/NADP)